MDHLYPIKITPFEIYRPRTVMQAGIWEINQTKLKIYGILADGKNLTDAILNDAHVFVSHDLPALVAAEGDDNGLGFVIIHPGDLGVSVVAHW